MAHKKRVIIFSRFNARLEKVTDEEYAKLAKYPNVAVEFNLEKLQAHKPHHWKLTRAGRAKPMTAVEKEDRDKAIVAWEKEHGPIQNMTKDQLLLQAPSNRSIHFVRHSFPVLLKKAAMRLGWMAVGAGSLYAYLHWM